MKKWIASLALISLTALLAPAFAGKGDTASVSDGIAPFDQHATNDRAAVNPQFAAVGAPGDSLLVDATSRRSEPSVDFGRSVADAAVPGCLDPRVVEHAFFVAEGLLRMPFLVNAAADGRCR